MFQFGSPLDYVFVIFFYDLDDIYIPLFYIQSFNSFMVFRLFSKNIISI